MLSRGTHVVVTDDSYRRTRQFLNQTLHRYGIEVSTVPAGDYDALEDAIRPTTRALVSESPTNPYNRIVDLERFAAIGRRHRVKTLIDATFATPYNQRPLELGMDVVMHSATKFLGGHNDLLAGAVLGSRELVDAMRALQGDHRRRASIRSRPTCSCAGSRPSRCAWSARTRTPRPSRSSWPAHPRVAAVHYAGLPSHPEHEVAQKQMRGFGGVVSFEVRGDLDAASRVVDACRIPYIAGSLGGVESLIEQPAIMSFYELTTEERLADRHQGQPHPLLRRDRGRRGSHRRSGPGPGRLATWGAQPGPPSPRARRAPGNPGRPRSRRLLGPRESVGGRAQLAKFLGPRGLLARLRA